MPGLAALKTGYRRIKVRYRNLPDGAQLAYRTAAPALAAAIGDWFGAQLRDHGSDAKAADVPPTPVTGADPAATPRAADRLFVYRLRLR